jgi:hypothetical protein
VDGSDTVEADIYVEKLDFMKQQDVGNSFVLVSDSVGYGKPDTGVGGIGEATIKAGLVEAIGVENSILLDNDGFEIKLSRRARRRAAVLRAGAANDDDDVVGFIGIGGSASTASFVMSDVGFTEAIGSACKDFGVDTPQVVVQDGFKKKKLSRRARRRAAASLVSEVGEVGIDPETERLAREACTRLARFLDTCSDAARDEFLDLIEMRGLF